MHAGQQITPTLRLVRPLGQGAMGSVWVADHLALATQVAVKFMSPAVAQHAELAARFRREATAAAQIKSPHVAQVFDHGIAADGSPYIVMELLEGEDLGRRITRLGPLPPREVARILTQAAKALGRAHQLGIVHRDIKPDNLFLLDLDGESFVKILDFGVAKQEGTNVGMTSTGSIFGTPLYMSPEQILSTKHVDHRADLWALGVVVYHALTGHLPFLGETIGALAVAVNAGVYTPATELRRGLPGTLDAWMARALQRDPAARFGSAKEMAEALDLALGGLEPGRIAMGFSGDVGAGVVAPALSGSGRYAPLGAVSQGTQVLSGSEPRGLGGSGPHPMSGSGPQAMSGSGVPARTFQGVAIASPASTKQRGPVIFAVVALGGLMALGGSLLWVIGGGSTHDVVPAVEGTPAANVGTVSVEPGPNQEVPQGASPGSTTTGAGPVPSGERVEPQAAVSAAVVAAPAMSSSAEPKASQGSAVRAAGVGTSAAAPPKLAGSKPSRKNAVNADPGF